MPSRDCDLHQAVRFLQEYAGYGGPPHALDFYAKVGLVVGSPTGGCGSERVGVLADSLEATGLAGLDTSVFHKAATVPAVLAPEHVRVLCEKAVRWRAAAGLASSNLSTAERTGLVSLVASGRLTAG